MILDLEQGSQEWLDLRKTKITATDAPAILSLNPWVSPEMLMARKKGIIEEEPENDAMRRGRDLEPIAREIYEKRSSIKMNPTIRIGSGVNDWAMCSTDGESETTLKNGKHFCIEIKSGKKAYEYAKQDHIPDYYLAQIQHILWLTDCAFCHYCAFDGKEDLIVIKVFPNLAFIEEMKCKEIKFYQKMMDETYVP